MSLLLSILNIVAAFIWVAIVLFFLATARANFVTAKLNADTARICSEIQASMMKIIDDNLAREKERQQWVSVLLEEKAE